MNRSRSRSSQLVSIVHRSSHHAKHSGPGILAGSMPGKTIESSSRHPLPWRVRHMLSRRGQRKYSNLYNSVSVSKEVLLLGRMLGQRGGLAHFYHAERDFYYTRRWAARLGWQVAGTFHKPPADLRKFITDTEIFRTFDGIFCLGTNQVEYFHEVALGQPVWFVPYGVDATFFNPGHSVRTADGSLHCLIVGQHLRNFDLLSAFLKALHSRRPQLRVTAVVAPAFQEHFPHAPRITFKSGISDRELRDLYRSADFMALGLYDSVANTALMEALAGGLPIVVSDVGAVRDYLDEECAMLCPPGSVEAMVEAATQITTDAALQHQLSWTN